MPFIFAGIMVLLDPSVSLSLDSSPKRGAEDVD